MIKDFVIIEEKKYNTFKTKFCQLKKHGYE